MSLASIADKRYTTFACEVVATPAGWPRWNWEHDRFAWFALGSLPCHLQGQARAG